MQKFNSNLLESSSSFLFYHSTRIVKVDNRLFKKISMACKNICVRYKAIKTKNGSRYISGQKRCQVCDIFMRWDGLYCPCCGFKLRVKPRSPKYRKNYRLAANIQYI